MPSRSWVISAPAAASASVTWASAAGAPESTRSFGPYTADRWAWPCQSRSTPSNASRSRRTRAKATGSADARARSSARWWPTAASRPSTPETTAATSDPVRSPKVISGSTP